MDSLVIVTSSKGKFDIVGTAFSNRKSSFVIKDIRIKTGVKSERVGQEKISWGPWTMFALLKEKPSLEN